MRLILVPDATAAIIAYDQRIFPVRSAVCVETHKRLYIGMELLQLTRSECIHIGGRLFQRHIHLVIIFSIIQKRHDKPVNRSRSVITHTNRSSRLGLLEHKLVLFRHPICHHGRLCLARTPRFLFFTLAACIFALNTTRSQPLSLTLSLGTSRSVTPFDVMSRKTCTLLLDLLLFPSKHTSLIIFGPQALRIWIPRSLLLFPTCHASHAEASCKGNSVTWRAY